MKLTSILFGAVAVLASAVSATKPVDAPKKNLTLGMGKYAHETESIEFLEDGTKVSTHTSGFQVYARPDGTYQFGDKHNETELLNKVS